MPRLRRRAALFLCAVCMLLFLSLYFLINNAAPAVDKKPNFGIIEDKLQRLETGLRQHKKEMLTLKDRLESKLQLKWNAPATQANAASKLPQQCVLKAPTTTTTTDVQMLQLYSKASFQDIDGGVWKQGWNIKYDALQYNKHHKLKVFVVPHSHNDPGWTKTFEEYYEHDTKHILSNGLRHLRENPDMKFIWAEISYFARFYQDLGQNNKQELRRLINNHQLEFVTGGWVMPDEANSHWLSVLMQLTEGQTWLKKYLNVTPTSSWSIDPFGHSPTLPYVLKLAGFDNLLIQRTHYIVKKELALQKQLEFHWRQLWDNTGYTDLFTHMMPFYSYDIPHTCGPDPKICCQFDFKRLPGFGLNCPWRVPPKAINEQNVAERAALLIDQWKKKAQLYRTNALLIPLGDDFRYSQSTEWDVQRINYEQLFEHINSNVKYAVEAKFGTLQEYFDEVHKDVTHTFPTLSGDFFTYADRTDNYWSGYYTSRPYHKRMDRVLLHYVRSAEMLHAWCHWQPHAQFDVMLQDARRQLSLFQHHDGITGTARTHVVLDYEKRMLDALKASKFVMQQAAYQLLTKPTIYNADYKFEYFYLDDSRWPGGNNARNTIILGEELPSKHVVFHNSLPQWREELIDLYVSSAFMKVQDFKGNFVKAQLSAVWTWHRHTISKTVTPQASATKYRLCFKVKVPPLGLSTYIISISSENAEADAAHTTYASNLILADKPISYNIGDYPKDVQFSQNREFTLRVGNGPTLAFSADGLMKSMQLHQQQTPFPLHLKFLKYAPRINGDYSGAYLFLPNGPATPFVDIQPPVVLVVEGPLDASVSVGLPYMVHETVLRADEMPEIRNLVDIAEMDNTELVMRLSTHIKNEDVFYTDLNGLQMIKRRNFNKLPLQANYYPIPTAIYIEDTQMRLTVVSAQPLGGSSLATGEIEIMQDRRLTHDDERGLGQGVLDNQPVLHIFRILLEDVQACQQPSELHAAGALTLAAHSASKTLLHAIDKLIFVENLWLGVQASFGEQHAVASDDVEIAVMRSLEANSTPAVARNRKGKQLRNTGIVLHRTQLMHCRNDGYVDQSAKLTLQNLLQLTTNVSAVYSSTITFLKQLQRIDMNNTLTLCPMDTKAFIIQQH